MNVDKLLVEAGAYFGGDGINYERFEPRKFADLVLAITPPQREWVGLTDKEIYEIGFDINVGGLQTMKAYKAIEAKLKAKNEHL
jgi:hypothetical protein